MNRRSSIASLFAGPAGLLSTAAGASAAAPSGPQSGPPAVDELFAHAAAAAAEDRFSGTVLVSLAGGASGGAEHVTARAYGLADRETGRPNHVDTKLNLGSLNKLFTATAIAQLAERGLLSFQDPIRRFIPELSAEQTGAITLHHLLTHTSGFGDYRGPFASQPFERTQGLRTLAEYLPVLLELDVHFPPGTANQYSNAAFVLLGLVVERAAGRDYYQYVREHIYAPAGMVDTDAYPLDAIRDGSVPNVAIGYTRADPASPVPSDQPPVPNWATMPYRGVSAGGGYSTVVDLWRFANAIRRHVIVGPDAASAVFTRYPAPARGGYGGFHMTIGGTNIAGMNGGSNGISAWLDLYLDLGHTVAVLSNYDIPAAPEVANRARQLLAGADSDGPRQQRSA